LDAAGLVAGFCLGVSFAASFVCAATTAVNIASKANKQMAEQLLRAFVGLFMNRSPQYVGR
jgi:hypothetical protein